MWRTVMEKLSMALRQFVPCLFVVVACSDSTPRNLDTLIQEADIYLDSETMEPYSGPVAQFAPHDETVIEMKGELVDGRLNGWVEKFATVSGTITSRIYYSNGEQQGPYERLTDFGDIFERGIYHNGEQCGEWVVQANISNYDRPLLAVTCCSNDRMLNDCC
jgi:hypothetical protein